MCAVIYIISPYKLSALSNHILLMCYHQHLDLSLSSQSSQQLSQQSDLIHIERCVDFVCEHDGARLREMRSSNLRRPG